MNLFLHPGNGHIYFFVMMQWTFECFWRFFSFINCSLHSSLGHVYSWIWDDLWLSNSSFVLKSFWQSSIWHLKHLTKFEFFLFLDIKLVDGIKFSLYESPENEVESFGRWSSASLVFRFFGSGCGVIKGWIGTWYGLKISTFLNTYVIICLYIWICFNNKRL